MAWLVSRATFTALTAMNWSSTKKPQCSFKTDLADVVSTRADCLPHQLHCLGSSLWHLFGTPPGISRLLDMLGEKGR